MRRVVDFCRAVACTHRHPAQLMINKLPYHSISQFNQFVQLKDYRPATKTTLLRNIIIQHTAMNLALT